MRSGPAFSRRRMRQGIVSGRISVAGTGGKILERRSRRMRRAVRRELAVAIWVGPKSKIKTPIPSTRSGHALSPRTRQGRGTQIQAGEKPYRTGMDISWLDGRIAVGGAIWHSEGKMAEL